MKVLIAGVGGVLGAALPSALAQATEVTVFAGDLLDRAAVAEATATVDAVVCGLPDEVGDEGERLMRASCGVYNLMTTSDSVERFILLSSLRTFESYPAEFQVSEYWAPLPTTDVADLVPFTAEGVVREVAQARPVRAVCLRLAEVVAGVEEPDPRAVHVDDAVAAVGTALAFAPESGGPPYGEPPFGWWVFHIVGAGRTRFPLGLAAERSEYLNGGRGSALGYRPQRDLAGTAAITSLPRRDVHRLTGVPGGTARHVVIFGAGGPFGGAAAGALAYDHVLRLASLSWPENEVSVPQQPGAPLPPRRLGPPHELAVADVTDYAQVVEAMRGMDLAVSMSVVRDDPVEAFRVNTVGAYLTVKAAAASGMRRVVLTGPNQVFDPMCGAYWADFHLGSDVPQRPGEHLYMLSKFLGQEIMRIFAEEHDMEIPNLVFGYFATREDGLHRLGGHPFMVAWEDVGESIRRAVCAPTFPRPYEVFHVQADMPHGKYRNERVKEVLGWRPRTSLANLYLRDLDG